MTFRVLDIETIPDESVWTKGEPTYRLVPSRRQLLDVQDKNVVARDAEGVGVEAVESFPPAQAHRVVAVATVDVELDVTRSPRYRCGEVRTDCRWSAEKDPGQEERYERALLAEFAGRVEEASLAGGVNFVTWNGRGFDLPVISMRSLKVGVPCKWYYADRDVRYRYSQEGHLDLMDFFSDYGAARHMKLGDVARLVGLPGKTGMTGASVHDVYLETVARATDQEFCEARRRDVARYCLQDSVQTALVFLRSRFHLGKVDRDEYHACLDTFASHPDVLAAIDVDWDAVRIP